MDSKRAIEKVFRKFDIHRQPSDFDYWQTQPYEKRLEALEESRREYHGVKGAAEPRIQRVYRIIKR
jgi:hypothetical protein